MAHIGYTNGREHEVATDNKGNLIVVDTETRKEKKVADANEIKGKTDDWNYLDELLARVGMSFYRG